MENFVAILVYLVIGACLRRMPQFPNETGIVLNQYVLFVALPAVVLLKIPQLVFSTDLLLPALIPWVLLLLVVGLVLLAGKVFNWSKNTIAALLVVLPLGNTSFLGFPMVEAFFGSHALPLAIIYDQAGSFVALATYATILAAVFNPAAAKPTFKSMAIKVITFPSFIALVVALLVKGNSYPTIATSILESLSATLVPVIMVAVGFQFQLRLESHEVKPLLFALPIKLLVMPLIAYGIVLQFDVPKVLMQVVVFEAAMPVMISAGAIAIGANLAPRMTSALVALGLVVSFVTLPLWYWVLSNI
ncbi:AEC family transporter [Pseudoalteromonas xiamenensis]